jgi:uncharacterized membrane protein
MRVIGLTIALLFLAVSLVRANPPYARTQARAYTYTQPTYYQAPQQVVVGIPVNPDYYYSVGQQASEQRIAAEVVKRLNAQDEAAQQSAPVSDPATAVPKPLERRSFSLVGANLGSQVRNILQANCIKCHKPGANRPGVALFAVNGQILTDDRAMVYEAVASGDMPKGKKALSQSELDVIKRWAAE